MISPVLDRLNVFVSSTIKECAAERAVVREAILSINHEPVLFEAIGARPHPPRELYQARLAMSQIFVGIYRSSYGWIAPDSEISGIEDEFRMATERGMDRLIYVHQAPIDRDPRLDELIATAKNAGLTVAPYSHPAQLAELVRNDVTAVVSNRFVDQVVVSRDAPSANEVLEALLPNRAHRFRRADVEKRLLQALRENGRLLVTAPLGGGKTVLLSQLAAEQDWILVDGHNLSRLDLTARTANALRERAGQRPIALRTEQSAARELLRMWESMKEVTLAVDSAGEPLVLWELPADDRRLVLTSRAALEVASAQRFEVPPLTRDEIDVWVTALRASRPSPSELTSLLERSGGNPLYLRFYALGGIESADLSLRELEIRSVQALPPRAREIISYLALSSRPLLFGDLQALLGPEEGPEAVGDHLAAAAGLVRQTRGHVQLVHEHLKGTIRDQLHQSPARLAFFASQLGRHLHHSERYVAAFHVYLEAGERLHADRLIDLAAHQAGLMGGGAPAISIFRRKAELAVELGRPGEQVHALLSLAFALKQTGSRAEAHQALLDAREVAAQQNNQLLAHAVAETAIVLDLSGRSREDRLKDLRALRTSYLDTGDAFDAARVATLLAAEAIASGDYVTAEETSREALNFFVEVGDDYGKRVARVNLAAALSGIDGREHEAAAIVHEVQQEFDPEEYPRERAVLCNLLTRHYRGLGNTALASEFALEAIQIGEELQDRHVIAINRSNLGNVWRDEGALDQALAEYRAAEQSAVAGGMQQDEASANELIASVLNDREQYTLALHHAQHAAAMAHLASDPILIARADEERAIALNGQHDVEGAVRAYTDAAAAISGFKPAGSLLVSLLGRALSLCQTSHRVDLKIQLLSRIFAPDVKLIDEGATFDSLTALYAALPEMAKTVSIERLGPIVALSMADLLSIVPRAIERRIILQGAHAVLAAAPPVAPAAAMSSVAALLMAHSHDCLTLLDLVDLAERIAGVSNRVFFKPHFDGTAHWTIRLEIAEGVLVTVTQLDGSPRTAVTAMIIALQLASLDSLIRRLLLDTEELPRNEIVIDVSTRSELEAQMDPGLLNFDGMPDDGFAVSESTDVSRSSQPPTLVACGGDFGKPWNPTEHALSDAHLLFGQLLRAFVPHLLGRTLEPDVLFPKIGGLIRTIGYRG